MGVDIHMFIVEDKKIVRNDIFDGRNSQWFSNIQKEGPDEIYESFPIYKYDVSNQAPDELVKEASDYGYYGHASVRVGSFKKWFEKYHPERAAGWVTTYDKWRIERQGYVPFEAKWYLDKDDIVEDWWFVEWEDPYDCSKWLYNYLIDNKINDNADITYWFDH